MLALIVPLLLAASTLFSTPPPTQLPEIGHVNSRASCVRGQRTLAQALPILIHNDAIIGNTHAALAKLDASYEASTILTITRTRTASSQIFKNLTLAKDQIMKLHVMAAAATNSDESQRYTAVADALDAIVKEQDTVADTFNGFADTADMGMLYRGSDLERETAKAIGPGDSQSAQAMSSRKMQTGLNVDVGALTTNVFRDVADMRTRLTTVEQQAAVNVNHIVASCNPPAHKP